LTSSSAPLTVAIVSWNTRDLLAPCLESFAPDADAGVADVWVIDNASDDGSAEMVRQHFPWVNLIEAEGNIGFGPAVNRIAERTDSEWIAPANSDIAVRPGALERLLEAGAQDPGAGAVAPRLVLPSGETQDSIGAFPTITFTFLHSIGALGFRSRLTDRYGYPGRWDQERSRRVEWAVAAFIAVRRRAWDEVGGFDERQWMYAEDVDLGWRLDQAGWATRYEPDAVVDHHHAAATSQQFGAELAPVWQRATYGSIARRRGTPYARVVAFLNVLGALRRWPGVAWRSRKRADPAEIRALHHRWIRVHLNALDPRERLAERR
jgi:GT2 family glycosyltransferase